MRTYNQIFIIFLICIIIFWIITRNKSESFICGKTSGENQKNLKLCEIRYEENMCPKNMNPKERAKCLNTSRSCPFPKGCYSKYKMSNSTNKKMARVKGKTDAMICQTKCNSMNDCCYIKNPDLYRTEDHLIQ